MASYLSLSISSAALWASLDIRENVRTGVRRNPAATRGANRDDDDDDKLPAGKALRSMAGVERTRKRRVNDEGGSERATERREEEVREERVGGRGGCRRRGRSGRGGESTNEETNALRSKEHACARECCKEEQRQGAKKL